MKRPLAYITAAWYSGNSENAELAAQYRRAIYDTGFASICPALFLPLFPNDAVPEEHKSSIDIRCDLLRRSRVLVVKWCANYNREYGCLPLDCECYMLGKCWMGAYCRYFRESVLPLNPALEAALNSEGAAPEILPCPVCGRPIPIDGRRRYCSAAYGAPSAKAVLYAEKAGLGCGKLGPIKPADFKAFRGRFGNEPYLSTPRPDLLRCFPHFLKGGNRGKSKRIQVLFHPAARGHWHVPQGKG